MLNSIDIGIDETFPFYIFDEMLTKKYTKAMNTIEEMKRILR